MPAPSAKEWTVEVTRTTKTAVHGYGDTEEAAKSSAVSHVMAGHGRRVTDDFEVKVIEEPVGDEPQADMTRKERRNANL